jgi:septum formation protein
MPVAAMDLCLASASPRRRELLEQIGARFIVDVADIDETWQSGERADHYVLRMAREKARAVQLRRGGDLPILGADTSVVVDGAVLGKPRDRADALAMLDRLSGREHEVLAAVCLVTQAPTEARLSISRVRFRALPGAECSAYWDSGEPVGKAGAYAIQGLGAVFIESLSGSYSGVMGLPLFETAELLRAAGVPYWQRAVSALDRRSG